MKGRLLVSVDHVIMPVAASAATLSRLCRSTRLHRHHVQRAALPEAPSPPQPRGTDPPAEFFRCGVCFDANFPSRRKLAQHLRDRHFNFRSQEDVHCPYCASGRHSKHELLQHVYHCPAAVDVAVPHSRRHMLSDHELQADQRYVSLLQADTPAGRLTVRPMHPSHIFEAAFLITEAFLVDTAPPGFAWTIQELERDVQRYAHDPSPITQGILDLQPDIRWEPPWDPKQHSDQERADAFRIAQLHAWGRWIWLAAELQPSDGQGLAPGQSSEVVGVVSLMLHERQWSLQKLEPLSKHRPEAMLDSALWVLPTAPAGLPTDRAAFLWWTATSRKHRRQGIAQLLLAAAEKAALRAGFENAYVQANTRQRDTQSPLGGWFNKEYSAATRLYTRTGYSTWVPQSQRYTQRNVVLMHKPLAPLH